MCDLVWRKQYRELLRLRLLAARRDLKVTLSQIFIGAFACILLSFFQLLANNILSGSTPHYPAVPVGAIPPCEAGPGVLRPTLSGNASEPGCYTLLFAPNSPQVAALVGAAIARSPGLSVGVDVAPVPGLVPFPAPPEYLTFVNVSLFANGGDGATCASAAGQCGDPSFWASGYCVPCAWAFDNRTMTELTTGFPGGVQSLVWAMGQYWPFTELTDNLVALSVSYNLSLTQFPFNKPARAAEVKRALDEALLGGPSLDYALRDFPRPPPRVSGFDVFTQSGAQWTFLTSALLFFQLITSVVVEKEEKLRIGMRQMGLRTSAYWASWGTYAVVMSLLSTLVLLASGNAAGFTFFTNATPLAAFLLYFSTSLAYAGLALLLSSLVSAGKTAQQLGYSLALVSFMFIAVVGSGSGILLNLLYSTALKPWMVRIRQVFMVVSPALAFTFVLYDIALLASSTLNIPQQRIVPGVGFFLGDLTRGRNVDVFNYACEVPSPMFHLGVIVLDGLLYTLLGLWFDAILPGPQGSPAHPLFCCGLRYKQKPVAAAAAAAAGGEEDTGVAEERAAAASTAIAAGAVVRIRDLSVVYRRDLSNLFFSLTGVEWADLWGGSSGGGGGGGGGGGQRSSGALGAGDVLAVDGLSLTVREGEIVALLGHTGAGKSTTIHVLTGLASAAAGAAEVAGYDVVAGARPPGARAMGVCPQHDLLFPKLTAREMLTLFCALKGLPEGDWRAAVEGALASVSLADVGDRATATYSGGMKRRLSVALATLGAPPLLLFDEPSTGLDPLARGQLLALIQGLKRASGILLTTHSMSEAAALGDRIAIMAAGRLVALGTTVDLTQRYGKGYTLSLTLADGEAATFEAVRLRVAELAPAATLMLRDGAAATFSIPFAAVEASLPPLLEWCDAKGDGAAARVQEFGVSGPTLEEAFLSVTAASHFGLAEQALRAEGNEGWAAAAGEGVGEGGEGGYAALAAGEAGAAAPPPMPRQYKALLVKNLTLLSRQRGLCLCQLFTPILILGLLLLLQYLIITEVGDFNVVIIPAIYLPLNMYPPSRMPPQSSAAGDSAAELRATLGRLAALHVGGGAAAGASPHAPPSPSRTSSARLLVGGDLRAGADDDDDVGGSADPTYAHSASIACTRFYLFAVQPRNSRSNASALAARVGGLPYGRLPSYPRGGGLPPPSANASGFLAHLPPGGWCPQRNGSLITTPFFSPRGAAGDGDADAADGGDRVGAAVDAELLADLLILNAADASVLQYAPPCWPAGGVTDPAAAEAAGCPALLLPDGAWTVHELRAPDAAAGDAGALAVTIQPNTAASTNYHRPNGVSRPMAPAPGVLTLDAARLGAMDLLTRAYANWSAEAVAVAAGGGGGGGGGAPAPAAAGLPLLSVASTMAERRVQTTGDIVEILGAVLFVILLSAPLPLFIFVHVTEKELRLNEMQMIMGVRAGPVQVVNFGVNAAIYAAIVALFWGVSGGYMQLRTMSHTSPLLLLLSFVGHGLALTATASLVGAFVWDRQVATVLGVLLGIITPLIATSIMAGVYGQGVPWALGTTPPPALYAIPILGVQFALARILYLATFGCLAFFTPLTSAAINPAASEVGVALWSLYINAVWYSAAGWYLERVLPRRYGVPLHPLFCLGRRFSSEGGDAPAAPAKEGRLAAAPLSLNAGDAPAPAHAAAAAGAAAPPFAYTGELAVALGVAPARAAALYAKGEDSDVHEARRLVEEELWGAAEAERARTRAGGGGGSGAGGGGVLARYPIIMRHLRKTFPLDAAARAAAVAAAAEEAGGGPPRAPPPPSQFSVNGGGGGGGGGEGEGEPLLLSAERGEAGVGGAFALGHESDIEGGGAPYCEAEQGALLAARGVKVAVSDTTLAIPAGAVFGLLGENGAGKTTTLAMLQGLYPPSGGGALVGGADAGTEQAAVRLRLGVCPQHDVVWPMLTVAEHLLFYARIKGVPPAREGAAVAAMLRRVGLAEFANRQAAALSGGMRRRLSVGIAMMGEATAVVLLDELTTGLDPASRRAVWRMVEGARRATPAALFLLVSHDMAEVEALCSGPGSACAVMTHGRVRCVGTVQRLRERYGGGCVLRVSFRAARVAPAEEATRLRVGAVLEGEGGGGGAGSGTAGWAAAAAHIAELFPPGRGSAKLDGAVFQSRTVRARGGGANAEAEVVEAGSAAFIIRAGRAGASGAELSVAAAFRALLRANASLIVQWAIEAQTLEAVFSRVVRHYAK